jgi:carboxyl-terminal processing protease
MSMGHCISRLRILRLAGGLALTAASLSGQSAAPAGPVAQAGLKFARVYALVEAHASGRLDPDHLIFDGGIRGMLATLDPFSAFFDQQQFAMLQEQARGQALGFGSILYVTPGKVLVLETAPGSPSFRAGLGPGDEIVEINGQRVDSLSFQSLIQLLRGARSHPVRLGVIHPGHFVAQDFDLRPAEVALPTVDLSFKFAHADIGYVHISGFESNTPEEVYNAVRQLGGSNLKGLLLDLRDNHGGIVESAIQVASLFLKPGQTVLTVRGRSVKEKTFRSLQGPAQYAFPMVVLVNGGTASAAEVLAAALEEHDRAVIAGQPTFGKGLVQSVFPLPEQTGMALVTAQYFTPSGRSIQRPLPGTALEAGNLELGAPSKFHTDDGRPLTGGGGITPDAAIPDVVLDPWMGFLSQGGYFTSFASEYLTLHARIARSFEPNARVLEDFRDFLHRNNVRTPEEYWSADQGLLKLRIRAAFLNLVYGLKAGTEAETRGDPQVQKAMALFPRVSAILRGPKMATTVVKGRKARARHTTRF